MTCLIKTRDPPLHPPPSVLHFDAVSEDRWRDDGGQVESREEKTLSTALRYPLYLIANDKGGLVANTNGKDCVLLFDGKELAERHIVAAKLSEGLYPLAIPNAKLFRQALESLPADVTCAIWDATVVPRAFVYRDLVELFIALEDG